MKKTLFLVIFTLFCIGNISALHVVEESPEYPGGMTELLKYMKENLQYPEEAIEKGIRRSRNLSIYSKNRWKY